MNFTFTIQQGHIDTYQKTKDYHTTTTIIVIITIIIIIYDQNYSINHLQLETG